MSTEGGRTHFSVLSPYKIELVLFSKAIKTLVLFHSNKSYSVKAIGMKMFSFLSLKNGPVALQ